MYILLTIENYLNFAPGDPMRRIHSSAFFYQMKGQSCGKGKGVGQMVRDPFTDTV